MTSFSGFVRYLAAAGLVFTSKTVPITTEAQPRSFSHVGDRHMIKAGGDTDWP